MISLLGFTNDTVLRLAKDFSANILAYTAGKNILIDKMDFSPKVKNIFRFNRILTLEQLLAMGEKDFLSLNMLNEQSANEVRFAVADFLEENAKEIRDLQLNSTGSEPSEDTSAKELLSSEETRTEVIKALREAGQLPPLEELNLSNRSYNCLKRAKKEDISGIIEMYPDGYETIRNAGVKTVEELRRVAEAYIQEHMPLIKAYLAGEDISGYVETGKQDESNGKAAEEDTEEFLQQMMSNADIQALLLHPEAKKRIAAFIAENDVEISKLGLSPRARNSLKLAGVETLSEALHYYPDGFSGMKNMGAKTVEEVRSAIETIADQKRQDYLLGEVFSDPEYSDMGMQNCPEDLLHKIVLHCFRNIGFKGLRYADIRDHCPQNVPEEQLKSVIGKLIREEKLEYVDFRCYRRYPSVIHTLESTDVLDDREKDLFRRRLEGETFDSIGRNYNLTRERVRQIEAKCLRKIRTYSEHKGDPEPFDEEYYAHFFAAYDIPSEFWSDYSGVPNRVQRLLSMLYEKGSRPLEDAIEDDELDVALKIRISDYLNRDMIYLDGRMVKRDRHSIEEHVIRTFCHDDIYFDDFVDLYNSTLRSNRIEYDPELYITEAVRGTRQNKVEESHFCLWKYGKSFRYYDVDAGDYGELYEALSLEDYENTEVTTLKFMDDYPELMRKYDIRDQYELHNLIRKTADRSLYHDLDFQRQPTLRFGEFDRDAAIKELLAVFSPISADELEKYLYSEYGYSVNTLRMTYLKPYARYLVNGIYDIAGFRMPADRKAVLRERLTEDFYPIRRIVALYRQLFPEAHEGEVNARDLRDLGFQLYSEYALKNYSSLDEYYTQLLTGQDTCTIKDKLRRYSATGTFYTVYRRLKKKYEIFLFEQDQLITYRKLEEFGVTKEEIVAFADAVFRELEEGEFFTVYSLRKKGFSASLDRLGFDDFFLTEILVEDPRFSSQRVFGSTVLRRTEETNRFSIDDFLFSLLSEYESIEIHDFTDLLETDYGITEPNVYRIVQSVRESSASYYYDDIMKTVYRDKSRFLSEFDE